MIEKIPYDELVYIKTQILDPIGDTLPTDKANAVFKSYQRLFPDDKQPQPCTCSSASKYWAEFIKRSREKVTELLAEYNKPKIEEKTIEENLVESKNDIIFAPSKKGRKSKS